MVGGFNHHHHHHHHHQRGPQQITKRNKDIFVFMKGAQVLRPKVGTTGFFHNGLGFGLGLISGMEGTRQRGSRLMCGEPGKRLSLLLCRRKGAICVRVCVLST